MHNIIDNPESRVVCAAMLMDDNEIVTGVRHFSPEMRITLKRIYGDKYHLQVKEQGFIDQFGNFLSRSEALEIAKKQNQIRRRCGGGDTKLYSENLY